MYDAIVVGAGPAGGMAARQLAAAGFSTLVLEKKRTVGEPVQCAEGVSRFGLESNGIRPHDAWIAQEVSGARCIVPSGKSFFITRLPGYAIDRAVFDRWIVEGAVDDGAELQTSARVTHVERRQSGWEVTVGGRALESRILVAADGPTTFVAKSLGLVRRQEQILAYEYRFRRAGFDIPDPDRFLLYIGERYDGGYAWIFPKGDAVNVGAGGHIDAHAATVAFCREHGLDPSRALQTIAGTIPYRYDLTSYAIPGFAVAGDAAGVANPMNGAGIHPGLFSGRLAGEFATAALEREDPSVMSGYDRVLRDSPFLDPLLWWMIERVRGWSDGLMDDVGEELDGLDWRAVSLRFAGRVIRSKPWLVRHTREFLRMIRALELCEHYGW
ncbi:MAG TPA: NAD(P)/FAD-dependent oxidoreductase [Thermoplasmata archaeon]|nr:NAD(P)/FAD-dependent oxidoreductase [Thermoplasmata archaeon]